MCKLRFLIIFLSLSILFLLFDWYHTGMFNLDYFKIVTISLIAVIAYQIIINRFSKKL